jgi:hemerythrin-like domain-containing protein
MSAATTAPPDVTGFLMGHRTLRSEFARLARAAGTIDPANRRRLEALETHLAFMVRNLLHHHSNEDRRVFPLLRSLDTTLADLIDELDQEHQAVGELLTVATDRTVLLPARAQALRDLHRFLARHLDREEAEMLPAVVRLVPHEVWEEAGKRFLDDVGRGRSALLAWTLSHCDQQERAAFLATLPPPVRVLYRTVWRPRQKRRAAVIYGTRVSRNAFHGKERTR